MAASKRMRANYGQYEKAKSHLVAEAFALMKGSFAKAGFDETVDASINLGIDPRKSDQLVSGSAQLPHGLGREVRVAAMARGEKAQQATAAGADLVGFEDLADSISKEQIDFDVLIASPDAMPLIGKLGRILGPKGLMPNPKMGTVSEDVEGAVRRAKSGQVQFRVEKKGGIVHCAIGKSSFPAEQLQENLATLLHELQQLRPSTVKGTFIQKVTVSSTMGPGITVDHLPLLS
ncbi:MAG: 50S ribosomal protein L1 [Candidatus Porifericomitaceae bacterium WSBS_2022_MAG_OTU9]